jgi:hypothetical protein
MCQPLTPRGAISLINSLVETSDLRCDIMQWKAKHLSIVDDEEEDDETAGISKNLGYLGKKYWQNFRKQHPEINPKKAVWFVTKQDDWCTYENFVAMYDGIYSQMVKSGIAVELPNEEMVTLDGTIMKNEAESYDRKMKYLLTRLDYVLFVDEVGCNTSQKSDGNVGGEKFVIHEDQCTLLLSLFQDCHFMVLGYTNGQGEPVCCVIILASNEVTAKYIMGLQPWAPEIVGDPAINIVEKFPWTTEILSLWTNV